MAPARSEVEGAAPRAGHTVTATGRAMEPSSLLRDFQREVLELAREQNVVMVGSTGIGKTFVAIALLAEQDYAGGKRAVFMAPTRQLVLQIAAKVRQLSTLTCRAYFGQEVELWDEQQWAIELRVTRVLVCTPEVVRNIVEKGYVGMDRINLLVFDECHHVTKRHPYAQLIKMYDAAHAAVMPRIFGATACPTKGCADALHATLKKVELDVAQMAQYAATAPVVFELYEKAQYGTADSAGACNSAAVASSVPQTSSLSETETETELQTNNMGDEEARICSMLLAELSEIKALQVLGKLLKKGRSRARESTTNREKAVRKFVRSCFGVYKHLGAWCYYRFVELELERLAIAASLLLAVPGSMFGLDKDAVTTLLLLQAKRNHCDFSAAPKLKKIEALVRASLLEVPDTVTVSEEDDHDDSDDDDVFDGGASARAAAFLVSALARGSSNSGSEGDDSDANEDDANDSVGQALNKSKGAPLQGIVFVHTRIECRVVTEYLNEKFAHEAQSDDDDDNDDDDGVSGNPLDAKQTPNVCGCMLGQGTTMDTAAFNLPTFQKTLSDFEAGVTRVLVSTAVSVEGVDFPLCGLVVVADRITTPRMFIQLRGRARHEDGVVYYLAEDGDVDHELHFKQLEAEVGAINALDFSHDKVPSVLAMPRSIAADMLIGHPFTPDETKLVIESTGAKLDLDSSVAVINQFCQSLPPSLFTIDAKRMYAYRESTHGKTPIFKCSLTLPPELELEPFESEFMLSKSMAKSAVAFLAGRVLWEKGLLDDSLNSVYRKAKSKAVQNSRNLDFFLDRIHQ